MQLKQRVRAGLRIMPLPEISQDELAYLQSLRNQLDSIQHEMRQVAKTVFLRLEKGAHVEPGTHKIRVDESHSETRTTRQLVLNGLALD